MADLVGLSDLPLSHESSHDDLVMLVLWCEHCGINHALRAADVERIMMTLLAAEPDTAATAYQLGHAGEDEMDDTIECLMSTLVRSSSSEGYLEHVEACIARRVAAEAP